MIFLIYPALMIMISGSVIIAQKLDTNNCTIEENDEIRIELCAKLEVIGVQGEDVILPCWFNHSKGNTIEDLHLLLYKTDLLPESIIFNSATNFTAVGFKGRIESLGIPGEGNGSVRIRYLKMEDQGMYEFRFEWKKSNGNKGGFSVRKEKEVNLRVDVRPQILNFGRSFVNSGTSWRLFCEAKAKPRPNITWWNPKGPLLNESQVLIEQDDPNKVQIIISTLNITNNEREGRYWCLAQNKHGTAHQRIYFCEKPVQGVSWPIVAWSTSLCLVLLVLAVGLSLYIKNWKRNEGTQDHTVIKNSHEADQSDENMYTTVPNTFSISDDQLYENI